MKMKWHLSIFMLLHLSLLCTFFLNAPPSAAAPMPNSSSSSAVYGPFFADCFAHYNIPRTQIDQILLNPNTPAFSTLLQSNIRNLRFNLSTTPKPATIISPTAYSHVSAAVLCAKKLRPRIQIKIRSGGHDYEGVSYVSDEPFVILDMANIRSINISLQGRTAWVESGAFLGELYYRIWEKSNELAFPAGVCPTLGIGGHISGAGYGNLIRKYGVSVDHVIDARIVDAQGRVLDRSSMGEDLFWAIRGGGGASFGVVLAFKVKLVPVPPKVTVFDVVKGLDERAVDLLYKYQQLTNTIDDDLFIRVYVQPTTVNNNTKTARAKFSGLFLGNATLLVSILNSNFPQLGLKQEDCHEMRWIDSVLHWYGYNVSTTNPEELLKRSPKGVNFLKRKSDYVKTAIPIPGLEALFKKVAEIGNVGLAMNSYGGIMSRIPENATAFPHRGGNIFKVQYACDWNKDKEGETEKNMENVRDVYDLMTPYVSKNPREAFLNYRDLEIGRNDNSKTSYEKGKVYGVKYFKGNFEKLVRIKSKVDPENVFRNEQSIPVLASSN